MNKEKAAPEISELERMAADLTDSGQYRVLRRVAKPIIADRSLRPGERTAVLIDTETTGLDLATDEVVEIGMLAITYNDDGEIIDTVRSFQGMREPSVRLSETVRNITGLTNEELAGKTIDQKTLTEFVASADLIVAHNAAFDRPMCEKLNGVFSQKPWACSATEIGWAQSGYESTKLKYLLLDSGFFYPPHRALDDCFALLKLLSIQLKDGRGAFKQLVETARQPTFQVRVRADYEVRKTLRARGYRWQPSPDPQTGRWQRSLEESLLEDEMSFLRTQLRPSARDISVKRFTAFERFKRPI